MRVLVCGDRNFANPELMATTLAPIGITTLIEGEARGADTLARLWAEANSISVIKFPANWSQYGRAAGPIRNKQMLTEGKPELVVAFMTKDSVGTRNMVTQAMKAKVPVKVVHI